MRGLAIVFLLAALPSLALAAGPLPVTTKTAATTATLEFPNNLTPDARPHFSPGHGLRVPMASLGAPTG
jgi:hypothetical protein